MKTIFITIFEGVESKNILRTGVVKKILDKDEHIKVVLFTKDQTRADFYENEFHDSRMVYEVVQSVRAGFWERQFSGLKFNLLQTKTTDLRAKMISEERGMWYYYFSMLVHRLFSRKIFIKIIRYLDSLFVKDNTFDKYFEKYKPDLIFLANLFEDIEINFLRSAKKYHVKSVGLINSWDRITARCLLRILPDKAIVFNNTLKSEMVSHNKMDPEDIFVAGMPQYDMYFTKTDIDKKTLFDKFGIDVNEKLVFYSPVGGMFSNSDWEMIDLMYDLNKQNKFGENVKILVSFPPNDFIKEEEIKKRPDLIYQYIGKRFSNIRSQDWDISTEDLENLKALLHYMSLIVCYASSISVDSAVFDKPVININFEVKDNQKLSKSPTFLYKTEHYGKALKYGGIRLVNNKEELVKWIRKYLADPSLDRESRRKLAKIQCEYTDGKSAERIAKFILNQTV